MLIAMSLYVNSNLSLYFDSCSLTAVLNVESDVRSRGGNG